MDDSKHFCEKIVSNGYLALFANISEFRVIDFWKMVMEKPWNYYVWDEVLRTLAEDIL
jgi:hypothetical protein